jgi:hypothetical protein
LYGAAGVKVTGNNGLTVDKNVKVGGTAFFGQSLVDRHVYMAGADAIRISGNTVDASTMLLTRKELFLFNVSQADWDSTARGIRIMPAYDSSTYLYIQCKKQNGQWTNMVWDDGLSCFRGAA